jgi:hypothetical protein
LRQRILIIVLGVVILLAIYTFFIRRKPSAVSNLNKTKSKIQEKASALKEQVKTVAPIKEVKQAVKEPVKTIVKTVISKPESVLVETDTAQGKWGTDPFVRDWVMTSEVSDLKLKAITQSGSKAYALINDQILEAGEIIAGKKIVSIEKDKVVLEQGDRTFTILLGQ